MSVKKVNEALIAKSSKSGRIIRRQKHDMKGRKQKVSVVNATEREYEKAGREVVVRLLHL
ncbi:hypothetical protein GCWU000325_01454 [Alloprevotella tannerae ATCC 51259]|uniref:Uncharacterized protein n=1 Tax=Alloprevotella tannerae ATCC 51259 TaxID=626522 RepID=C9LGV8_9BACT|nr:hypothetical protein GCWU000325_01454 [Alloprevotella tannerae ATCC 51259]